MQQSRYQYETEFSPFVKMALPVRTEGSSLSYNYAELSSIFLKSFDIFDFVSPPIRPKYSSSAAAVIPNLAFRLVVEHPLQKRLTYRSFQPSGSFQDSLMLHTTILRRRIHALSYIAVDDVPQPDEKQTIQDTLLRC